VRYDEKDSNICCLSVQKLFEVYTLALTQAESRFHKLRTGWHIVSFGSRCLAAPVSVWELRF